MSGPATYLAHLDLSYICKQMSSESYPLPRWSYNQAKQCEQLYKRFLTLLLRYPQHQLVPTRDIDEFWHNHILHTRQYFEDCKAIFGHYLHHQPSGGDDLAALAQHFSLTKQLYFKEFNQELLVFSNKG